MGCEDRVRPACHSAKRSTNHGLLAALRCISEREPKSTSKRSALSFSLQLGPGQTSTHAPDTVDSSCPRWPSASAHQM
eukprot:4761088-Amphidinium_carterae.1